MKREEDLDQLLDLKLAQGQRLSVDNEEIAACLAAAERLSRLQGIDVPGEVAARLAQSVRARARSYELSPQNGRTFSDQQALQPAPARIYPQTRRTLGHRASWVALLGVAALLILAFTGLLAHRLPGELSSRSQQAEHQLTPTFANDPQARVRVDLQLLQSVAARTSACREAVAAVPAGSGRATTQQALSSVLAQEEQTIRQLLSQVDWPMQLLFTRQLGVLGEAVPTVSHVTLSAQSNGSFLVTLTGTHFAAQAKLMVDGQPTGTLSLVTPERLVAIMRSSRPFPEADAFGVLNPDGTAAQISEDDSNGF
jgi:hypothetical protein